MNETPMFCSKYTYSTSGSHRSAAADIHICSPLILQFSIDPCPGCFNPDSVSFVGFAIALFVTSEKRINILYFY